MIKLTHASVFSGIGGPEVAATMLGWENLFHCEINPFGKAVLDYWYPNAKSYEDITKTDFTEWRGRVNVLTGGFPCQPFSYAGQRRGASDDRYLWPYMFRCIDQIRPDWVVAENVGGILTMVEQGQVSQMASPADLFGATDGIRGYKLRETFTLQRICDDLESHGYSVQPILIPACAVGAPHRRDRVFIVGCREDSDLSRKSVRGGETSSEEYGGGRSAEHTSRRRSESQNDASRTKEDARGSIRYDGGCSATDTNGIGQRHRYIEQRRAISGRTNLEETERNRNEVSGIGEPGYVTDTDSHRRSEVDEHMESQQPDGSEPVSNGRERDATDTASERLQTGYCGRKTGEESRNASSRNRGNDSENCYRRDATDTSHTRLQEERPEQPTAGIGRHALRNGERLEEFSGGEGICGERWRNFPTVSPVHRGNDGIPFPLDSLTLSSGKWRTEALKAYGNAIVPQVMYEIFRAIALTYE